MRNSVIPEARNIVQKSINGLVCSSCKRRVCFPKQHGANAHTRWITSLFVPIIQS
jgi:hypothetical protein